MLPLNAKKPFDLAFIESLFQHLQRDGELFTLVLRKKSGRKTDDPSEAHVGEIRNANNKPVIVMNHKESMVNLKHAGAHKATMLEFLKDHGVAEERDSYELGVFCAAAYAALVSIAGFFYVQANNTEYIYPFLLACVVLSLSGLALMAYAYRPGREKWSIPAMLLLFVGGLPTAPSILLVLPMIKSLGRNKLNGLLYQDTQAQQELNPID